MRKRKESAVEWRFALLSLLLLVFFTSVVYFHLFLSFKLYIDDADPFSYRAVVPIMFLITLVFFCRGDLKVDRNADKFVLAIVLFALADLLLVGADSSNGFDALSMPFFVGGCTLLFFSIYTLKKLLFPLLYLLLLWTPLFQPLISMQPQLTNFTSDVVAFPIKSMGFSIERQGNVFSSDSKVPLEIVSQCVPLSAIIAFFCFILPFAYVATGSKVRRFAWLIFWIFGIWVLDVLRILLVLFIWYYSGISDALNVFHSLGGNIIFDLALVLSLLSLGLFRLDFPF